MITNGFELAWLRSLGRHAEAETRIQEAKEFLEKDRNSMAGSVLRDSSNPNADFKAPSGD